MFIAVCSRYDGHSFAKPTDCLRYPLQAEGRLATLV